MEKNPRRGNHKRKSFPFSSTLFYRNLSDAFFSCITVGKERRTDGTEAFDNNKHGNKTATTNVRGKQLKKEVAILKLFFPSTNSLNVHLTARLRNPHFIFTLFHFFCSTVVFPVSHFVVEEKKLSCVRPAKKEKDFFVWL